MEKKKKGTTTKKKKATTENSPSPRGTGEKLVIVESPTKSRTINRFLGDGYRVVSTMGHFRDLPPSKFGVDIEKGFEPTYQVLPGKEKTARQLQKDARNCSDLYLATDEDREGEAIAWHTCHLLKRPPEEVKRVVFHEITPEAIERSFRNPRHINDSLVKAQQARRIVDRIVGYTLSPILGRKIQRGLSAGRVQSAALRILVEREREIEAFVPEKYFVVKAELSREENPGEKISAVLTGQKGKPFPKPGIKTREEAEKITGYLGRNRHEVTSVTRSDKTDKPLPPYTTSTLQQDAGRRLGFSASRTMVLAQQLYEGLEIGEMGVTGLITYHRTDSLSVAAPARQEAAQYIGGNYGREYLPAKPPVYRTKSRNAQEAHEAIRPTSVALDPRRVAPYLTEPQLKLYSLVWKRFVASQMAPALFEVTKVLIECGPYYFALSGKTVRFDGHRKVLGLDREEDLLPSFRTGETILAEKIEAEQKETNPPQRYTEAALIKAMEKLGIGRPSTYAPTIETLCSREYVRREKKAFFATRLGCLVNDLLVNNFTRIVDPGFTAQLEEKLDDIARGNEDWRKVLDSFYGDFIKSVRSAETALASSSVKSGEKCPECGQPLSLKRGKFGPFWGCDGFPECAYTRNLEEKENGTGEAEPVQLEEKCPECGGQLIKRKSRYGFFAGCAKFPECRYTRNLDEKGNRRKFRRGPGKKKAAPEKSNR